MHALLVKFIMSAQFTQECNKASKKNIAFLLLACREATTKANNMRKVFC